MYLITIESPPSLFKAMAIDEEEPQCPLFFCGLDFSDASEPFLDFWPGSV